MNKPGVYEIRRVGTDQCYVGSTSNLRRRRTAHLRQLKAGDHHAARLQNSWNKYGAEAFEFKVLELVDAEGNEELRAALMQREQVWIDRLKPCFNSSPVAGSTLGFKMPREIVERHRRQIRGRKATPEEAQRLRTLSLGCKRSPETIEKLRNAGLRRSMPQSAIENSAAARRGKKLSAEHIEKVRAASTGRRHDPEVLKARSARLTPETRERMGAGARGKPRSPEHAAKIAAAVKAWHERRRNGEA
jgi:group I intron endonuclease